MYEINKIAIDEGIEDLTKFREDSTVVETNIHYPTNNSLVWDCINASDRLLKQLQEEITLLNYEDYRTEGKKTFFKINVTGCSDQRADTRTHLTPNASFGKKSACGYTDKRFDSCPHLTPNVLSHRKAIAMP